MNQDRFVIKAAIYIVAIVAIFTAGVFAGQSTYQDALDAHKKMLLEKISPTRVERHPVYTTECAQREQIKATVEFRPSNWSRTAQAPVRGTAMLCVSYDPQQTIGDLYWWLQYRDHLKDQGFVVTEATWVGEK